MDENVPPEREPDPEPSSDDPPSDDRTPVDDTIVDETVADTPGAAAPPADAPAADATGAGTPAADAAGSGATAGDVTPGEGPVPDAAAADATPGDVAAEGSRRDGRVRVAAGAAALLLAGAVGAGIGMAMSDDDGPDGRDAAATRDFPDMEDFPGDGDAERVQLSNVFAGTIEDVGDDELTIDTGADDVVDIAADNDTTVTDTTEVGVDDLAVGDTVRVVGEPSDDDTVEASQITASDDEELLADSAGPGFGGGPHGGERPEIEDLPEGMAEEMPDEIEPRVEGIGPITAGTIESIDGETITVTTEDGDTVTVTTSSSTTVQRVSEISWDDLEAGDEVTVFVDNDGDNLTATAVRRGEDIFVEGLPPRWGPDDDDADSADHPDA